MSSLVPAEYDPNLSPIAPQAGRGPGMAALAAEGEEGRPVDVRRLLAAIQRYKWLVAACSVLGTLVGLALSRVQRPSFEARATIWVQTGDGAGGPIQTGQLLASLAWVDLLRSFVVLEGVAREQRLFLQLANPADSAAMLTFDVKEVFQPGVFKVAVDPAGRTFTLSIKGGSELQRAAVTDSVGPEAGFVWVPGPEVLRPGREIEFAVSSPHEAALRLDENLTAKLPSRDGNFMRLILRGTVPTQTAAALNSISEHFVAVAASLKRERVAQLSAILEVQLRSAADDLARAENELENFRIATITEPTDPSVPIAGGAGGAVISRDPVFTSFLQMRVERDQAERDRARIQAILARTDSAISPVELQGIPSVVRDPELSRSITELVGKRVDLNSLRATGLEAGSQRVRQATDELNTLQTRTIPSQLRNLASNLGASQTDLDTRIRAQSRELQNIPQRTIREARLTRNVNIAQTLYTTLLQRYEEARLGEQSTVADVKVLDRAAVPQEPIQNLAVLLLGGGLLGGFGLSIAAALTLDRFDRRIRYPDQVTRDMGLTILGTLPRLKSSPAGMRGDDAAQMVEALRTIRLNLVHAYGTAGPIILTVTSPGSGDGKSFLASNLALTFADAGQKTLLIDGDIRRGALHRVLNVNRKPGLIDYLGGTQPKEAIVQTTRVPLVDFIGCGTRKLGGPELLASQAMSQLLIGLRSNYAVIILDSAPLGAGVDPLVLGSLTGNLLLVLRTGVTDREYANAKMANIERLPIRVLGAVLNDVRPEGIYRYYSYLPGYASEDEKDESAVAGSSKKQISGVDSGA